MAMSEQHKAALAEGRRQAAAIRRYLEAISRRRPGRPVTPETIEKRLAAIEEKLASETSPLKKVDLVQQRLDLQRALEAASAQEDLEALESAFIAHAKGYSERKGITYAAWREVGVPAAVLRKAGISRAA